MNEMNLLRGHPIQLSKGIQVYPLTLNDVADLGQDNYNLYLSCLALSRKQIDLTKLNKDEINELKEITDFDFTISMMYHDLVVRTQVEQALSVFTKEHVFFDENIGIVIVSEKGMTVINESLFKEMKKIIYLQNYISNDDENSKGFNPANEKARQLKEKMDKIKEKIKKDNKEEGLSLKDITSIVATYSNDINLISVWELTVYQLYEAYLRLIMWDNYHTNFMLLPHIGGKELDLKHWASQLEINKN